jgi:hypothetical protein
LQTPAYGYDFYGTNELKLQNKGKPQQQLPHSLLKHEMDIDIDVDHYNAYTGEFGNDGNEPTTPCQRLNVEETNDQTTKLIRRPKRICTTKPLNFEDDLLPQASNPKRPYQKKILQEGKKRLGRPPKRRLGSNNGIEIDNKMPDTIPEDAEYQTFPLNTEEPLPSPFLRPTEMDLSGSTTPLYLPRFRERCTNKIPVVSDVGVLTCVNPSPRNSPFIGSLENTKFGIAEENFFSDEDSCQQIKDQANSPEKNMIEYCSSPYSVVSDTHIPNFSQCDKPEKTFCEFIVEAINACETKRIRLQSIYKYIMGNYPYFRRSSTNKGWKVNQSSLKS